MEAYLPLATTYVNSIVPAKPTSPYRIPLGVHGRRVCTVLFIRVARRGAEPSGDLFAPPKFIAIVMIKRRSSLRHAAMQTGNEGAHGCPGATGGIFGSPEDRFSARRGARCHLFTAKRFAPKPRNRVISFPIKRPYSRRTERREERGREGGEGKDDMAQINAS